MEVLAAPLLTQPPRQTQRTTLKVGPCLSYIKQVLWPHTGAKTPTSLETQGPQSQHALAAKPEGPNHWNRLNTPA